MLIKGLIDEDFINYKKPCMVIEFPHCSFKCDKECGKSICQNLPMVLEPNIEISIKNIVSRYVANDLTQAIVFQGLEPFDSWDDVWKLIVALREVTLDDIVIYTGYTEEEIYGKMHYIINNLKQFPNIIIKFGRFIPDQTPHYDKILGVKLASNNQYAQKIS